MASQISTSGVLIGGAPKIKDRTLEKLQSKTIIANNNATMKKNQTSSDIIMTQDKKLIKLIQIFVFINGACITALEITASRVLAPYFGTTLLVWGSIIGITLIALALGYYYGGKIADRSINLEIGR